MKYRYFVKGNKNRSIRTTLEMCFSSVIFWDQMHILFNVCLSLFTPNNNLHHVLYLHPHQMENSPLSSDLVDVVSECREVLGEVLARRIFCGNDGFGWIRGHQIGHAYQQVHGQHTQRHRCVSAHLKHTKETN